VFKKWKYICAGKLQVKNKKMAVFATIATNEQRGWIRLSLTWKHIEYESQLCRYSPLVAFVLWAYSNQSWDFFSQFVNLPERRPCSLALCLCMQTVKRQSVWARLVVHVTVLVKKNTRTKKTLNYNTPSGGC